MIYSRALRSLLSIVSLTPTPRSPALDSYFHPGTSIPTSILISRLNLLPAVSRSQPGSNPSSPSRLFRPLAFHSFSMRPSIAEPWIGQSYLLAISVATPRYCATNRFSTLLVFLLSIHLFCPFFLFRCSAISRLYLLTDSFAITRPWHSYRLFQSSCPNVGSMTSACTG